MTLWKNCLYITLFINIVAGIVQTFIKSCNQLLYPRVIEICRLLFKPHHDFFLHLIIIVELPSKNSQHHFVTFRRFITLPQTATICLWISAGLSLLRWEILWRKAPRIWRDFGLALPFQTRLTQTKSVLPLSNEHGSQVKDQGRRQSCRNKHKISLYRPTSDVFLLYVQISYVINLGFFLTHQEVCWSSEVQRKIDINI